MSPVGEELWLTWWNKLTIMIFWSASYSPKLSGLVFFIDLLLLLHRGILALLKWNRTFWRLLSTIKKLSVKFIWSLNKRTWLWSLSIILSQIVGKRKRWSVRVKEVISHLLLSCARACWSIACIFGSSGTHTLTYLGCSNFVHAQCFYCIFSFFVGLHLRPCD